MHSPASLIRSVGIAAAICGSLATCTFATAPERPLGAVPLAPPAVYSRWWAMAQSCSGVVGPLAAVSFWQLPGEDSFIRDGRNVLGYWTNAGNQIVLAGNAALDGGNVRHEMLHALLRVSGHSRGQFLAKCAGLVDCGADCIADAGPAPAADPAALPVSPRLLEVAVDVAPASPSLAQDGGHFTVTVSVRNPQQRSVIARLGTTNIKARSFQFEVRGATGSLAGNEIVLDASSVTFAPGETKRQVFDFAVGTGFAHRRVPPGEYTVLGGYGVQIAAPRPLTVAR